MSLETMTINSAMRYIYDQMERVVIPDYFIIGEAGRAVYDGVQIETPVIEVGIREKEFTKEVKSNFDTWGYKFDSEKNTWETQFEGVTIKFRIFKRDYQFFKILDTKFYDVDEYHVPNPFEKYWKARYIVK